MDPKHFRGRLAVLCAACLLSLAWGEPSSATDLSVKWKDGLRIESAEKDFTCQIGGRIQTDWAFFHDDEDVPTGFWSSDGTEFRRARLFASGTVYRDVFYKAEWDFAGGEVVPKDVFIGLQGVPVVGNIRIGNQKEPFSLDEITSDSYIAFIERGLPGAFVPSRNPGFLFFNDVAHQRVTWSAGFFRDDNQVDEDDPDDVGESTGDGEYAQTFRVTGLPLDCDDGRSLIHLGAAMSHRTPPGEMRSYSFRPESHLASRLLSTGGFPVDDVFLLGGEAAAVVGPLSLQGEIVSASHDGPAGEGDPSFASFYVFGSYFVTGENRAYDRRTGTFSRVAPRRNFGPSAGGSGAVELVARLSRADLDDEDADAEYGTLTDVTLGANWYLNPMTRVSANYVHGHADRPDFEGNVHVFQTRFQIDF